MTTETNRGSPAEDALARLRAVAAALLDRAHSGQLRAEWAAAMEHLEAVLDVPTASASAAGPDPAPTAWGERLLYQELFDFAPDTYLVTDRLGVIRAANHAAARLLRTRKEFLTGKPLAFFVAPDSRRSFFTRLLALLSADAEVVHDWDLVLHPPRGPEAEVNVNVTAVGNDGGVGGLRWLIRDVTPRQRSERALQQEKHFSDRLLDTARALVLLIDPAGRILRSNAYLHATAGYRAADLDGQDWCVLLLEADRERARALVRRTLEHGAGESDTSRLVTRDGGVHTVAWSAKPLAQGPPSGAAVLVVGHDITELQEAQRQAAQVERLAAIGQLTAALAHEGRNALQRIHGGLERLRWRIEDRPDALDVLRRVQAAQQDLTHLFDDIRAFAGPLRLETRPGPVDLVWRDAWDHARAVLPDKAAELVEVVDGLDLWCTADPFRLGQVFRNVFENALTAAPAPVRVTIAGRAAVFQGRPALEFIIRDNGPGLSDEQRARIFEPFYTTKARGTGLGMAIAKRIVDAHGGTIAADSAPAGGAEIRLTLPRSPS